MLHKQVMSQIKLLFIRVACVRAVFKVYDDDEDDMDTCIDYAFKVKKNPTK